MKRILFALLLAFMPTLALAGTPSYTGNVNIPASGSLKLLAGGTGCALVTLGAVSAGNCPVGTAVFAAGTNITITGSNPYTINCPNCAQTTGATFTGAVTFSSTATFNALLTASAGITSSSTSVPITIGTTGNYSPGIKFGTAGGFSTLATSASSLGTCNISASGMGLFNISGVLIDAWDLAGNQCSSGTIYYTSSRYTKQNIHAADIDGLAVFRDVNFNLAWEYLPKYGDPHQVRYGPMAEDLPAFISGPKRDRIDLEALVVAEGVAIHQLDVEQTILLCIVAGLGFWLLLVSFGLALVWNDRDRS